MGGNAPSSPAEAAGHLRRALGRADLVLLFVVAVVNLNVVPAISANGPSMTWLWLLALIFFFWPQGIAVIELGSRFPGEGGVYLWAKKVFGDFHGFLSGWCYWTNNIFYVPTVLLYFVGTSVFVMGDRARALAEIPMFALAFSLFLLVLLVALNILGLGVGKWVNNLGGAGTFIASLVLAALGAWVWHAHGSPLAAHDFAIPTDPRMISSFGIICFGLVGLELASVMGDEIRDPLRTLPPAVAWGGLLCGVLYIGATLTLLVAIPQQQIGVLQGVVQAVAHMASQAGISWITAPFALLLSLSIAGIASAWLSGSARIPFVAGLDRYLPAALGRIHPRFATPHIALIVQGILSAAFLAMNFIGAQVKEAFVTMLDLAVVLQLVPFLYMYAALIRLSFHPAESARFRPMTLRLAGTSGFITTAVGMAVAFVPSHQISSIRLFLTKMFLGTAFFLALAWFFYFVYGRKKLAATAGVVA